ncbi:MAG: type IV secretory system conjugative DNA transfer family protein [Oscillospiraceae bacterium]|nr:type IV secretory system conjugative DNA transfer family protein [Oscillospiraceae bacterium]
MTTKKKAAAFFIILYALIIGLLIGYFGGTLYYSALTRQPISAAAFRPTAVWASLAAHPPYGLIVFLFTLAGFLTLLVIMMLGGKKGYRSQMLTLTPDITIPAPAGQMQHNSARFLRESEYKRVFSPAEIDLKEPLLRELLMLGEMDQALDGVYSVEPVKSLPLRKPPEGIPVAYEKAGKKKEALWNIRGDVHTLVIGATRSGKTRTIVLQSIVGDALAGKDMFLSDPKGELYQYTYPLLKRLGYHVCVLDFKDPELSEQYNFLQAIIDHLEEENTAKAIAAAWDVVDFFVKETTQDPIWGNGEKAIIASAIMVVCYENSTPGIRGNHPDWMAEQVQAEYEEHGRWFQNFSNVYYFVFQMLKPSPFDPKRMILQVQWRQRLRPRLAYHQ